jgi:serine/threonine protein kinase
MAADVPDPVGVTIRSVRHLSAGTVVGAYRIEELVATGGFGVVYRARHLQLERRVALKTMRPELAFEPVFRERFHREARRAARLDHPHIVSPTDFGEGDGVPYFVMPFIDGEDLARTLQREGRLEPRLVERIVLCLADALDHAHERGIVHRDVKPANVLVESLECTPSRLWLTDFGIARAISGEPGQLPLTRTGQRPGTPAYMSPEQLMDGPIDHRTDVYSLGCLLFEALTGSRPFERGSVEAVMLAHLSADPPRPSAAVPSLPRALDDVVARALAKRPAHRFRSAGDLARAMMRSMDAAGHPLPRPRPTLQRSRAGPGAPPPKPAAPAPARPRAPVAAVQRPQPAVHRPPPQPVDSRREFAAARVRRREAEAARATQATSGAGGTGAPDAARSHPLRPGTRRWLSLLAGVVLGALAAFLAAIATWPDLAATTVSLVDWGQHRSLAGIGALLAATQAAAACVAQGSRLRGFLAVGAAAAAGALAGLAATRVHGHALSSQDLALMFGLLGGGVGAGAGLVTRKWGVGVTALLVAALAGASGGWLVSLGVPGTAHDLAWQAAGACALPCLGVALVLLAFARRT